MRRDEQGAPLRFVGSYADITERKHAEERSREDRRKLFTLMSNLPGMAYRCRNEPGWPMMFVSEGATALTGHTPDEMLARDDGYGSLIHPDDAGMVWEQVRAALDERRPFQMTYRIIDAAGTEKWVWEQGCGVWRDDGSLRVLEGFITDVTDRVNAFRHLEQTVEEKTRELRLLLEITHDVAELLELRPLAGLILDRVKGVVEYTGAAIFVLDEDGEGLNLLRYQGPIPQEGLAWRWTLSTHEHARAVIESGAPVIIADVFDDSPLARSMRRNAVRDIGEVRADFGTWMGVPLLFGDQVTGMLAVDHSVAGSYTERHAELLSAVANQAAVAVENARLFEQVRGLAALEERQKLARELHDSVSQALYGIGLGARTARTLLDRDPAKVKEPLEYVISLAEAGLAEMRALIFELRPDALETEGITGLLDKQAAAIRARHGIQVETGIETEPDLPLTVKEMLYRIAQESLNNTIKHARASRLVIRLAQDARGVMLELIDDGIGFDPGGRFPGHLGLRSMRERAARHGATLELESAPGQGTRVCVFLPQAT
jgi:PAS domain S-box-containing protein